MRVLQINVVYGEKSTGRTCAELERFLLEQDVECYTAYGVGAERDHKYSYQIETKLGYTVHNVLSRLTGLEGYFSKRATKRLIRYIQELSPDVIHLRNLHGHYLSLPMLFDFLKKTQIPLVISLHDCWIFTGKCPQPVLVPCDKWTKECGHCPVKKEYPKSWLFDRSKHNFCDKKRWLSGLNVISVLGVSKWVADQAKQSFLNQYPIRYIYNWIDSDVFKPYPSSAVLEEYRIPRDRFTVICVAAGWQAGSRKVKELEALAAKLVKQAQILVIGGGADVIRGENVYPIGFLSDTAKLAQLYAQADVYVHLSAADTFGKVIAEAMACGTPAVVYDCTACSELVTEGCGYAVPVHDVDALCAAVLEVKEKGKSMYSEHCIARVARDFDYRENCRALLSLYKEGL